MIGRLKGILLEKFPPYLLIDVQGVGYEVQASMQTFYQLPEINEEVTLFTQFVVREDAHLLYGFYEEKERALFRMLIKVNGVGPKMALAVLSSIDPESFVRCVSNHDIDTLTHIPGVGKKTAERLIVEMRDRLNGSKSALSSVAAITSEQLLPAERSITQDAISALISLGYKPQDASRVVSQIESAGLSREELIRLALKNIS